MFKLMLFLSTMFQLFISTSIELLGNERGEVVVDPDPVVEPVVEPEVKPTATELKRELSKELGINLFDFNADEFAKFKEFQDNQKTEIEKANEIIESYKSKEAEWEAKQVEYNSKLKASELGIAQDKLEDALKLAGGNPDNLAEVIKKYPIFISKEGIQIGVQQQDTFQDPNGLTEQEKYMAAHPEIYKK